MRHLVDSKKKKVKPDEKGRITLGRKHVEGVSSFLVTEGTHGKIILEPLVEIPAREKWLFENKKALASVERGIQQAGKGKVKSLGSFSKYAKEK